MNGIILVNLITLAICIFALVITIIVAIKNYEYEYILIPSVFVFISLITTMVFIFSRVESNRYCEELREEKAQIEKVIEIDDDKNIAIYQKVIDYNNEIARIKTLQKKYGYFSNYYGYKVEYIDLDN